MKPNISLIKNLDPPLSGLNEKQIIKNKKLAQTNIIDQPLREILAKTVVERSFEEIIHLYEYLLGYRYFLNLKNLYGQEAIFRMAQNIGIDFATANSMIQKKNEEALNLIVILDGQITQNSHQKSTEKINVQSFNPGDDLFEELIQTDQKSKYDYVATKETMYLLLDKHVCRILSFNSKKYKLNSFQRKFLLQFDWIGVLGETDRMVLLATLQQQEYKYNDVILSDKDQLERIYFVKQGTIKILQSLRNQDSQSNLECKGKDQRQMVCQITDNDIFGFEEFIQQEEKRKYNAVCDVGYTVVYSLDLKLFFRYFNMVFNISEFLKLQKYAQYRCQYRDRIHEIQQQLFSANKEQYQELPFEKQQDQFNEIASFDSPRISSKKRSKLLTHSYLLPNDLSYQLEHYQASKQLIEEELGIENIIKRIDNFTERKRVELKLKFQLNKMLVTNRQFKLLKKIEKNEKQQLQTTDLQNQLIKYKNNKINLQAFKRGIDCSEEPESTYTNQFKHISLSVNKVEESISSTRLNQDKQNREIKSLKLPQLNQLIPNLKQRRMQAFATPLRRYPHQDRLLII